ncbi:MAG: hypothetical protein KF689_13915 [Gemmatimonadaceae bacterium]|nr:hypothetical protein [Gemmatimonadaceae bacterium]MCW5826918.1 hypothetical protein [Gemmatimonadaceae bacterium]
MRRLRWLLCCLPLAACEMMGPYDRTNPFDPGAPYPMILTGVPDTVDARGVRFTAVVERDPPLGSLSPSVKWGATDPRNGVPAPAPPPPSHLILSLFDGEFVASTALTAEFEPVAIFAQFGARVLVSVKIVVGQRARTLTLSCGSVAAPLACDASPVAVGDTIAVRSTSRDANNHLLSGLVHAMDRAIVTSRNPDVAVSAATRNAAGTYAVAAVGGGSTWIVITVDFATDSVRIVVNP